MNTATSDLNTFIKEAKNKRLPKLIDDFIASGGDINATNPGGDSAMRVAINKGPIQNLACLLDHGAILYEKVRGKNQRMSDLQILWSNVEHYSYKDLTHLEKADYLLKRGVIPKPVDLSLIFSNGMSSIPDIKIFEMLCKKHAIELKEDKFLKERVSEHLRMNLFGGFYCNFKGYDVTNIHKRMYESYLTEVQTLIDLGFDVQSIDWNIIKQEICSNARSMKFRSAFFQKDPNILDLLKEAARIFVAFLKKNNYKFEEEEEGEEKGEKDLDIDKIFDSLQPDPNNTY